MQAKRGLCKGIDELPRRFETHTCIVDLDVTGFLHVAAFEVACEKLNVWQADKYCLSKVGR